MLDNTVDLNMHALIHADGQTLSNRNIIWPTK